MRRVLGWGAKLLDAAARSPPEWEVRGRRFVEQGPISEGGFAFVVQVRDLETDEIFALKKMICQDSDGMTSAMREVDVLENLPSHKNIVSYYGHTVAERGMNGCPHQQVLILLELCTGGTLLDMLDKYNGLVPEKKMLKAVTDIAEAVFCLHSHVPPLLHRDLKLENVLRGDDGFWKVIDFGSWSDQTMDLTSVNVKELGKISEEVKQHTTMMYRPPEMVDVYLRYPITCQVDTWMLGCILYSLLYYKHPFGDSSALAIREAKYSLPPREPEPSAKMIDLLIWLLAPDPRHRPSSRKLVTTLWQWKEEGALELPEPVLEHRAKLLAPTVAAASSPPPKGRVSPQKPDNGGGHAIGSSAACAGSTAIMTVDDFVSSRGRDGAAASSWGHAATDVANAAAAFEPWTASFADFGGAESAAGAVEAAPVPAVDQEEDDWAFQGADAGAEGSDAIAAPAGLADKGSTPDCGSPGDAAALAGSTEVAATGGPQEQRDAPIPRPRDSPEGSEGLAAGVGAAVASAAIAAQAEEPESGAVSSPELAAAASS